jgi:hypothetical protein
MIIKVGLIFSGAIEAVRCTKDAMRALSLLAMQRLCAVHVPEPRRHDLHVEQRDDVRVAGDLPGVLDLAPQPGVLGGAALAVALPGRECTAVGPNPGPSSRRRPGRAVHALARAARCGPALHMEVYTLIWSSPAAGREIQHFPLPESFPSLIIRRVVWRVA